MKTQLSPYLTYNGNAREAMTFYQQCFGGELTMQAVSETPIADQCPEGMQHHLMHSMLTNDGFVLMASDMQRPEGVKAGNDIALTVSVFSEADIQQCFATLSDGGKVIDKLQETFWGALFGIVQDKFGKVWMLNFDKNTSGQN